MSELGPTGGSDNPFGSFLGDMMKMFLSEGPLNWQLARQAALITATGGESESNVDPIERLKIEELIRIAEPRVADATGMATSQTGGMLRVKAVTRAEWAYFTLDAYRPLFEALATSLTSPAQRGQSGGGSDSGGSGGSGASGGDGGAGGGGYGHEPSPEGLLGELPQVLSQVMLGAQAGSLTGFLARRAFGQYDLPIPRPPSDELLVVPANLSAFASDWSLPADDLRLWLCLSEVAHHAVLGRPHVRARVSELVTRYAGGFRLDTDALTTKLETLDMSDPAALTEALGDPESLVGSMHTASQLEARDRLAAVIAALEGYVDHVLDTAGKHLIGDSRGFRMITEALRRRRVEATDADRLIEQLFGLTLSQDAFDRGWRFVDGVRERGGDAALARLWASARELPTPAEVDAPGLWLERIDIPE